jgi:hypothetical protein
MNYSVSDRTKSTSRARPLEKSMDEGADYFTVMNVRKDAGFSEESSNTPSGLHLTLLYTISRVLQNRTKPVKALWLRAICWCQVFLDYN